MRCLITAVLFVSGLAAQVRPERIAFFAVAAPAPTTNQVTSGPGSMTVQVGAMSCGAVMRSATSVQHYCYRPYPTVVHNGLDTVFAPTPPLPLDLIVGYNYGTDIVTWSFTINQGGIHWEVCQNAGIITTGDFTQIYSPTASNPPQPTETFINAAVKWSLYYNAPVTWSPACGWPGATADCPYLDINGKPVPNGTLSGVMMNLPCNKPKLGP